MDWKYKIDLESEDVFREIEEQRNIMIPDELKELVKEANAATPERYNFMLGADEKVFGAMLSFNKNETEADSVFVALKVVEDSNFIPFAIDPFGNYFCLDLKENTVIFWNHENDSKTSLDMSINELIDNLY